MPRGFPEFVFSLNSRRNKQAFKPELGNMFTESPLKSCKRVEGSKRPRHSAKVFNLISNIVLNNFPCSNQNIASNSVQNCACHGVAKHSMKLPVADLAIRRASKPMWREPLEA